MCILLVQYSEGISKGMGEGGGGRGVGEAESSHGAVCREGDAKFDEDQIGKLLDGRSVDE